MMKKKFDLHLHSNLSDGDYPPSEVIRIAKKNGLKAISITDHNTCYGSNLKKKLADKKNLFYIHGVEISTLYQGVEIHILGYGRKLKNNFLDLKLKKTVDGYNRRALKIFDKVKKSILTDLKDINSKEVKKIKNLKLPLTKYDIAKFIAEKLKMKNSDVLKLFANKGSVAYVPYGKWAMTPIQAINIIHKAKGAAILAHPGETYNKFEKKFGPKAKFQFTILIALLIKNRLDGFEIYCPKNDSVMKKILLKISKNRNLIVSGGSDWHGEQHHPEIKIGSGDFAQKMFNKFINRLNKWQLKKNYYD